MDYAPIYEALISRTKSQSSEADAKRVTKNTGKKLSQETKDRIAASKRGKKRAPFSDEWKAKLARHGSENGMYGRTHSDEAKRRVSEANKGRVLSDERKHQISQQHKGRKDSEATKALRSEAMKRVWAERKSREQK